MDLGSLRLFERLMLTLWRVYKDAFLPLQGVTAGRITQFSIFLTRFCCQSRRLREAAAMEPWRTGAQAPAIPA
jgi:hypothetical protein